MVSCKSESCKILLGMPTIILYDLVIPQTKKVEHLVSTDSTATLQDPGKLTKHNQIGVSQDTSFFGQEYLRTEVSQSFFPAFLVLKYS